MKIIEKDIETLVAYKNNPRKNDNAVEYVANSIREFGFKVPVIIDKDNVVVCGHTRLKAARELNINKIPCIIADDLTDEQIKAFRIADNKVSEQASWDLDLLNTELEDIDLDMTQFGFEEPQDEEDDDGYYGDAREATFDKYNLQEIDLTRTAGKWQMPLLKKELHVPKSLESFNYVLSTDHYENGIHFYIDDYQFERIWTSPHLYIEKLMPYDCALTPDFSLYQEMPLAMQLWNVYRSRLIGQIMQDYGIKVIPTLQWCREDSFEFCFDGIEPGGTVSVSTIGVKQDEEATKLWVAGMDAAIEVLKPKNIVVYGGDIGYDFGEINAVYFSNANADRLKNGAKNGR